MMEKKSDKL